MLIDNIPSPTGNHNAGDLSFGKDGYLYVSVGDGECDYARDSGCQINNDASRDPNILLGKILRITRNGGIPATNPYTGTDSARCNVTGRTDVGKKCQETFASGLDATPSASPSTRTPRARASLSATSAMRLGRKSTKAAQGPTTPGTSARATTTTRAARAPSTAPLRPTRLRSTSTATTPGAPRSPARRSSPTASGPPSTTTLISLATTCVTRSSSSSPRAGVGSRRRSSRAGWARAAPSPWPSGPTARARPSTTPPTFERWRSAPHRLHRHRNRPPTAVVTANPTSGPSPLAVDFDASGSSDPDAGDTLTYLWDFGDGSPTQTTTTPTTTHTYSTEGTYTASLHVRDNHGALSDAATVRIDAGNEAPNPVIESPSADLLFRVGQQITLSGSATDPEDGALPEGSLQWEVLQHHNGNHTHPVLSETGNNLTITAPMPEGLASTGRWQLPGGKAHSNRLRRPLKDGNPRGAAKPGERLLRHQPQRPVAAHQRPDVHHPQDAGLVGRLHAERKRPLTPDPLWEDPTCSRRGPMAKASNTTSLLGQRQAPTRPPSRAAPRVEPQQRRPLTAPQRADIICGLWGQRHHRGTGCQRHSFLGEVERTR